MQYPIQQKANGPGGGPTGTEDPLIFEHASRDARQRIIETELLNVEDLIYRQYCVFYTDFIVGSSTTTPPDGWVRATSGTATSAAFSTASAGDANGIWQFECSNVAGNNLAVIRLGGASEYIAFGKNPIVSVRFQQRVSDQTGQITWIGIGPVSPFTAANSTEFSDCAMFRYKGAAGRTLEAVTRNTNNETATSIGPVPVVGTWYRYRIQVEDGGKKILFFIDDVKVAEHTSNIPALTTNFIFGAKAFNSGGGGGGILDYVYGYQKR